LAKIFYKGGVVLPKSSAECEYGREQKETFKRKRYATYETNIEDIPHIGLYLKQCYI
jgi:hypothetical protein